VVSIAVTIINVPVITVHNVLTEFVQLDKTVPSLALLIQTVTKLPYVTIAPTANAQIQVILVVLLVVQPTSATQASLVILVLVVFALLPVMDTVKHTLNVFQVVQYVPKVFV